MHTTNAYAYNSVTQEHNKKNQTVNNVTETVLINAKCCTLVPHSLIACTDISHISLTK